jgi:hypothetical protein
MKINKMKTSSYPVLLLICFFSLTSFRMGPDVRNQKELFPGEKVFKFCRLYLPLDNDESSKPYCIKVQRDNRGKRIVLIRYDAKAGMAKYLYYYLISNQIAEGMYEYFLQTPDDYAGNSVIAIKYNYNPETDRFYVGDCFDYALEQHHELDTILTKGEYPTKRIRVN